MSTNDPFTELLLKKPPFLVAFFFAQIMKMDVAMCAVHESKLLIDTRLPVKWHAEENTCHMLDIPPIFFEAIPGFTTLYIQMVKNSRKIQ